MTRAQQRWAAQHDWHIADGGCSVIVRDYEQVDDEWHETQRVFHDYDALRAWAGY